MTDEIASRVDALLAQAADTPAEEPLSHSDVDALRQPLIEIGALADLVAPSPSAAVSTFLDAGAAAPIRRSRRVGFGLTGLLAIGAMTLGVSTAWATAHLPVPPAAHTTSAPTPAHPRAEDPLPTPPSPELSSTEGPGPTTPVPRSDGDSNVEQAAERPGPSDLAQRENGEAGTDVVGSGTGAEGTGRQSGSSEENVPTSSSDSGSR